MSNPDLLVYGAHAAFWTSFGVTRAIAKRGATQPEEAKDAPATEGERTARFSRALLLFHGFGFFVLYFGLNNAVLPKRVPHWFAGQRIAGTFVLALGAALMSWALLFFRSWRFRAKLSEGHKLATDGPFRLLRHPIYMGLNLFGLGTAIWAPAPIVWAGCALMALGSDLRARSEERLLGAAFGPAYADYCRRTKRFLPGIY